MRFGVAYLPRKCVYVHVGHIVFVEIGKGTLATAKLQSGVTIGMSLTIKDDATITATVYVDGAQNFTYDFTRVSNKIASDSAYMSVAINTAAVTTLVIAGA